MKIIWRSPSNIALIKYWGKHGNQLPNNPSLSLTLQHATTTTAVELKKRRSKKEIEIEFLFEGKKNEKFAEKITAYLDALKNDFPWLKEFRIKITSENTFPYGAGIASSASGMSALALCIVSLEMRINGDKKIKNEFWQLASKYARLGSGSAARSIYGEWCLWGKTDSVKNANDDFAIQYPTEYHSDFNELQDSILIVSEAEKSVSSRAGHGKMMHHPMEKPRYANAHKRLQDILTALKKGDWNLFCETTEAEALELHALMMTSAPSFILMKPNTLAIIEKVRLFRNETKIPACFTLDAGPNVHIIYPYFEKKKVRNFIQSELLQFCSRKKVIYDSMGRGPQQIIEE